MRDEPTPAQQYTAASKETGELHFLNLWHLLAPGAPEPMRQFKFHPNRKWLFDFAWSTQKVAVEYDGGILQMCGAHRSISGILRDINKGNAANALGWHVFRCTAKHLDENPAGFIGMVKAALGSMGDAEQPPQPPGDLYRCPVCRYEVRTPISGRHDCPKCPAADRVMLEHIVEDKR